MEHLKDPMATETATILVRTLTGDLFEFKADTDLAEIRQHLLDAFAASSDLWVLRLEPVPHEEEADKESDKEAVQEYMAYLEPPQPNPSAWFVKSTTRDDQHRFGNGFFIRSVGKYLPDDTVIFEEDKMNTCRDGFVWREAVPSGIGTLSYSERYARERRADTLRGCIENYVITKGIPMPPEIFLEQIDRRYFMAILLSTHLCSRSNQDVLGRGDVIRKTYRDHLEYIRILRMSLPEITDLRTMYLFEDDETEIATVREDLPVLLSPTLREMAERVSCRFYPVKTLYSIDLLRWIGRLE